MVVKSTPNNSCNKPIYMTTAQLQYAQQTPPSAVSISHADDVQYMFSCVNP